MASVTRLRFKPMRRAVALASESNAWNSPMSGLLIAFRITTSRSPTTTNCATAVHSVGPFERDARSVRRVHRAYRAWLSSISLKTSSTFDRSFSTSKKYPSQ